LGSTRLVYRRYRWRAELLPGELPPAGRARLPMTLKVTVKASLPELLNFRVRALKLLPQTECCPAQGVAVIPVRSTPTPPLSALFTLTLPESKSIARLQLATE